MGWIKNLKEEYALYKDRDPAMRSYWDVLLYPCHHALKSYRKAHKLWLKGDYFRARLISQRAARKTGIEIHPGATIGKGLFIDHGTGVVIGETTIIGDNCTLYQGVTLGGTGKETGKRHPTLKDGVMVSAGAKLIGSFTVGENSKIGAGSVVLDEVPPNCTVVGVPGRVVRWANRRMPSADMHVLHLPDPVLDDLRTLQRENSELVNRVLELEKEMQDMKGNRKET
jgi:serine O-acetyltransferase